MTLPTMILANVFLLALLGLSRVSHVTCIAHRDMLLERHIGYLPEVLMQKFSHKCNLAKTCE